MSWQRTAYEDGGGSSKSFVVRSIQFPLSGSLSRVVGWLLLLPWTAGSAACAQAQTVVTDPPLQLWLNPGIYSYHFDRNRDFREDNIGLGAEIWLTDHHALMAGTFINSDRARSRYGAYQWRPLHWRPAGFKMSAGVALGAFDGYPRYHNGGWFPAALPVLAVEYRRVGVNLFLVPTIPNRLEGAVAVQLKLRVW